MISRSQIICSLKNVNENSLKKYFCALRLRNKVKKTIYSNKFILRDQSAGFVKYTDCISAEGYTPANDCPEYDTEQSEVKDSNARTLANVEYTFVPIAPRLTPIRSGSTW